MGEKREGEREERGRREVRYGGKPLEWRHPGQLRPRAPAGAWSDNNDGILIIITCSNDNTYTSLYHRSKYFCDIIKQDLLIYKPSVTKSLHFVYILVI